MLSSLAAAGLPATKENLGRLFTEDEYLEELEVMAETRAYFRVRSVPSLRSPLSFPDRFPQIAFKARSSLPPLVARTSASQQRIIDLVPSAIDHDFIRALPDQILERLIRGLGIQGERGAENARAMLAQSATLAM